MSTRQPARVAGFTLIELMIVIAVISVLAAVAIVSFSAYQRRAKAAEAREFLASIHAAQEAYRGIAGRYAAAAWCPETAPVGGADGAFRACTEDNVPAKRAWRELGISIPDRTLFSYFVFAWGPEAGTPADCTDPTSPSGLTWDNALNPCDLDEGDDRSGWYAIGIGDQLANGTTAQFVTTHAQRGRVISLRDIQ